MVLMELLMIFWEGLVQIMEFDLARGPRQTMLIKLHQLAGVLLIIICPHIWRFISGNGLHKDEIFGSNTYNAVLDYQRKNNLAADSLLLAGRWK